MSSKRVLSLMLAMVVSLFASLGLAADQGKASAKKDAAARAKADNQSAEQEAKAPRLTIVEPIKDFGTVPKGDKLDWAFVIKNTGSADLQVLAARPSCGCTVADFDKVIKPGQSGKVTAHVDTTNFVGPISKTVTVETNDMNTPSSNLTINAVVKSYVEAYPAGFLRYMLLQGELDTQSFTLYSDEEEPFQIQSFDVPAEYIKVSYAKIEKPEEMIKAGRFGQNQYKVSVTVGGPTAPVGPLAERVRIKTNSKYQPEYYFSVTGLVRPAFGTEPTAVNFGEVAPTDAAAVRTVRLHTNNTKAPGSFTVNRAESSTNLVTAEVMPSAAPGDYQVALKVAKDAKPGDINGTVKIYTNDKSNPVVTLPISGTIKTAATVGNSK
jgi:hypothetical protein